MGQEMSPRMIDYIFVVKLRELGGEAILALERIALTDDNASETMIAVNADHLQAAASDMALD
jgi:hypothetical protein